MTDPLPTQHPTAPISGATSKSRSRALQRAVEACAAKRAAGELVVLDPIAKARANPRSLRAAVTAKCWDCVGAGADPNPRQLIRDCPAPDCPLYPVRPYQRRASV